VRASVEAVRIVLGVDSDRGGFMDENPMWYFEVKRAWLIMRLGWVSFGFLARRNRVLWHVSCCLH